MRTVKPYKNIVIDGGQFRGYKMEGFINIFRHKKTASVKWGIGSIDHLHVQSMAFDRYCDEAGMSRQLIKWFEDHKHLFCSKANIYLSNRWGGCRYIPHDLADDLAWIVKTIFDEAAIYSIDRQTKYDDEMGLKRHALKLSDFVDNKNGRK
ncbi:hypothetical protein [Methylotuvimicrobium sp. KM1]|uniref:hypothetical protein n=1 Tax=Methylotuvimicrobium sp. KM1 TaxID=3377707 RepID=UPI00384F0D3E